MPLRDAVRWAAPGLILAMLVPLDGCRWLPRRRPAASLDPRVVSRARPAADAPPLAGSSDTPALAAVPLPTLPLRAVSDAEALDTPHLDAALARAEAIEQLTLSDLLEPDSERRLPPPPPSEVFPPGSDDSAADPEPDAPASLSLPDAARETSPGASTEAATPASPESRWRLGLESLRALAGEQPDPSGLWAARGHVLARLADADDAASVDPHEALWRAAIAALLEAEPTTPAEPGPDAASPEPTLEIVGLCLCRRVDGFGVYEPADPAAIRPGASLTLYWEVEGLRVEQDGPWFRTRLASAVALLPPDGPDDAPVWTHSLGSADDSCRRPRRDYFVNGRLTLPDSLPPGPYRLRLTLDDLAAGLSTSQMIDLEILP